MKDTVHLLVTLLSVLFLLSCEGRTGYIDESQLSRVSELIGSEWLVAWYENPLGQVETFDDATSIYRFESSGNGWVADGSFSDDALKKNVRNFHWTFTADNFAVIYMTFSQDWGYWEEYWLIEKITPDELWIKYAAHDPAIYPNQESHRYRLMARRIPKGTE